MKICKSIWVVCLAIQCASGIITPVSLNALQTDAIPIQLKKKIVVLGTGLPGAGKSTLLKALNQKVQGSFYIDKDVINAILLQGESYTSEYYKKYVKNQSYELMLALAKDIVKNSNCTVMLDGFFGDKLSSPLIKNFLDSPDFSVKIIYFYCSPEVNQQRLTSRGDPRDHDKLNDFQNYYQQVTAIHQKELANVSHLLINTENEIDENVEIILDYLSNNLPP